MIVEKGEWKVSLENSEEHLNLWRKMIALQKASRDKWYYTTSRFFSYMEKDASVENWIYIDEYESEDSYEKGKKVMQTMMENEKIKQMIDELMSLCVKDSFTTTSWTEIQELRVD
ncbi:MAG: hypothetical protein ACXAC8_05445 [Candidatus Hodarchaeales archaeon]